MLPAYTLTIDIISLNPMISEELFREQVASSLAYLDALKGSFDRTPCTKRFHQYTSQDEEFEPGCWSVRAIVLISIGKQRAAYLLELYKAISHLIMLEAPYSFEVNAQINDFWFS
ncbi:MAG: hypothetical protein H0X63_10275 [Flavobacteriales bacterium]|nr:hypothetical protein [Flavobacteriales bacterium]